MDLDDLFVNDFLKNFEEKTQKKILINKEEQQIVLRKNAILEPIRQFLQKFIDFGTTVNHCDRYNINVLTKEIQFKEAQTFKFYDVDTKGHCAPGISIWFDHPAHVEIAVPNKPNEGVVVINISTDHPEKYLLEHKFTTIESACSALAKFIAKNTISIERDSKKLIKEHQQKIPSKLINNNSNTNYIEKAENEDIKKEAFFQRVPENVPLSLKKIEDILIKKVEHKDNEN